MEKRSLLLSLLLLCFFLSSSSSSDSEALLNFKSAADSTGKLFSWNSTTDPCKWTGVSCVGNRVTRLVLESLELTGSISSLASLTELRVLSLKRNRFSGPVLDLSNLAALKLLFLSENQFSGEFPPSVTSLTRLYRLDLSFNNFSGEIPPTLTHLTHLLTLRLESNRFSGLIPDINLSDLQDFNVSDNELVGHIPTSLSEFPTSVFGQNPSLCGAPLLKCTGYPTKPGQPDRATASPLNNPETIPSSPSSSVHSPKDGDKSSSARISTLALVAIILGDVIILSLVSLLLYCCFWRQYATNRKKHSKVLEGEKIVYSSSPYPTAAAQNSNNNQQQGGGERGRMVFFEGTRRFELEDLLRASAEMLGKGGFGTAYKAVLDDGNEVAVKRLKDAVNVAGKKEFEQQMEVLGRLRHGNLVSLKAYYFAREEKLLVCEYMPNGSLFWLLHGNRGPGRTPLDWTTRLKIAAGAARGVAFIHNSCKTLKLTHGDIKSTNVLLDGSGNARVSDFGLSIFAPSQTTAKSNGYCAPELIDGRKPTQKSDVYSFGVLLLEILTGKCPNLVETVHTGGAMDLPRWVQSVVREEWTAEVFDLELMRYKDIEEEMVGLLQIAMACTAATADHRPKMGHVVKMIEEIRGGGSETSPCNDGINSAAESSPCLSEDTYTCGGTTSQ
ncbi:putative leucine-rich repeat receptor-like protein kinase [Raphanus sativus]|uniref:Probable leucine-rich repeat receptor-like protein kinase At1g68400 n=1 Tax=Raphanus sativus TaxID=3726 RepID=A0A6J0KDE1_RAPSA|nr:probable leucine-rich repeat receptor-like protein kinase At1g68400 [Raphanus sativus]KAJ4909755.1 putative leucine-rich repeat receptor-like protein kinase [Raphanus sativus]